MRATFEIDFADSTEADKSYAYMVKSMGSAINLAGIDNYADESLGNNYNCNLTWLPEVVQSSKPDAFLAQN